MTRVEHRPTLGEWASLAGEVLTTSVRRRPTGLRPLLRDARRGSLRSVPLALIRNQYAFSYGPEGWCYLVDLAQELLARPALPCRDTRFHRFVQAVEAPLYVDLLALHDAGLRQDLPEIPHGSFPWGHFDRRVELPATGFRDLTPVRASQTCMWSETGASIQDILEREVEITRRLVRSIADRGYRLALSDFRPPSVTPLEGPAGEGIFVQQDGAHRLAVLAALGRERVLVRLDSERYPAVRWSEADRWPFVRSGLITPEEGRCVLALYFRLDGRERRDAALGEVP